MTALVVVVVVALVLLMWRRARRRRAIDLSGTNENRPVFSVEPPRRRMSPLKADRL